DYCRQPTPKQGPMNARCALTKFKPVTSSEIAEQVADAAVHERHQCLGSCAPGCFDAFIQINLRCYIEKGEGEPMQRYAREQPEALVERAKNVAHQADDEAADKDPFQAVFPEQASQRKHRHKFGDLSEGHPGRGSLKAQ